MHYSYYIHEAMVNRMNEYRYYQNGFDVTYYVMNELPMPISERFFEVEVR